MEASEIIRNLIEEINILKQTIEGLNKTIDSLNARIARLTEENSGLKERANKNSSNSSKPPSSDGYNKPKPKSLRKKSGRKPGGQEGHEGANLVVQGNPDRTILHYPEECTACKHFGECKGKSCHRKETRKVFDIKIETEITEHVVMCMDDCLLHRGTLSGKFPADLTAPAIYGPVLRTLGTVLSQQGLSDKKTSDFLSGISGQTISTGTITNFVRDCSRRVSGTVDKIRDRLTASPVNNYDETGIRIGGGLSWAIVAANAFFTLITVSGRRGEEGINANGVISKQEGVAVHDCWKPYWKFPNVMHALCNAHILRELQGILDSSTNQQWAKEMQSFLTELHGSVEEYRERGGAVPQDVLDKYSKKYDRILALGKKENPLPEPSAGAKARRKKGKPLCLIDRLEKYKDAVLMFSKNMAVPFTNNIAEQGIRNLKVKVKVAGCFRSKEGAEHYAMIRSYVESARKHGVNAYEAIKFAFLGTPQVCFKF